MTVLVVESGYKVAGEQRRSCLKSNRIGTNGNDQELEI
jgi:hypothetical protein